MSFKKQRKKAGFTQREVAEALGVTDAAVNLWENGKTMPAAKRLVDIANLFGCTIDDLLKEE